MSSAFEDGEVRIHIPVLTSPQVEFYVGGKRIQMEEANRGTSTPTYPIAFRMQAQRIGYTWSWIA